MQNLKKISFASPKGGVGRTMSLANIAKMYVEGASWIGLSPTNVLIIDFDLKAPGLHYYPFDKQQPTSRVKFRNKVEYPSIRAIFNDNNSIGIPHLLQNLSGDETFLQIVRSNEGAKTVSERFIEFFNHLENSDPRNPYAHTITIDGSKGNHANLYLLPAADPESSLDYTKYALSIDWLRLVGDDNWLPLINSIILFLKEKLSNNEPLRVLLDQEAGTSVPVLANQFISDTSVFVGGLSEQSKGGLIELLKSYKQEITTNRKAFVVISQYKARLNYIESIGATRENGPSLSSRFHSDDKDRRNFINRSIKMKGLVDPTNVFLTDFEPEAVQKEHFFQVDSPSYDSLLQLVVKIEREETKEPSRGAKEGKVVLVIGEFVGIDSSEPNGPLEGFVRTIKSMFAGLKIQAFAVQHETIAKLVINGEIWLRLKSKSLSSAGHTLSIQSMEPCQDSDGKRYAFDDFDFVCLPSYLTKDLALRRKILLFSDKTIKGLGITSKDSLEIIGDEYCKNAIWGWENNASTTKEYNSEKQFHGVPLFLVHQFIVTSRKIWNDDFTTSYQQFEYRQFTGFSNAADLLAAARAGKLNEVPDDRLIMSLNKDSVAPWYDWRTVLCMFPSKNTDESSKLGNFQTLDCLDFANEALIGPTLFYLYLAYCATKTSQNLTWDEQTKIFFQKNAKTRPGMMLAWPDAIPKKFRKHGGHFQFHIPPGEARFEECWLVVCPGKRELTYHTLADIERIEILIKFLTPYYQQVYFEGGGIPVHRSVSGDIENWRNQEIISELWVSFSSQKNKKCPKQTAIGSTFELASTVSRVLAELREFALELLKDDKGNLQEYKWRTLDFQKKMWKEISIRFKEIQSGKKNEKF